MHNHHHEHGSCCCNGAHHHHEHSSCCCNGVHHHEENSCCSGAEHSAHAESASSSGEDPSEDEHHHVHRSCCSGEKHVEDEHEHGCCCGDHGHHHEHAGKSELIMLALGGLLFIATEWLGMVPKQYELPCLVIAYLLLGGEIVWSALKNLFKGEIFDENFLMTVATLGAFAIQAWEEAVGVMLFFRIGEFFEHRAVEKSRGQITEAVDLRPQVVQVVTAAGVEERPAAEAQVGDILLVRVGDRVPLDGTVVEGESYLDTSSITGESVPVLRGVGEEIISGYVNTTAMLKLRVDKPLSESMVSKIFASMEQAAANKPQLDRFIRRFARFYTPVVVGIAAAVAIVPSLITGEWQRWIYAALTFLVISCPCALVISVPLSFFAGIGAGSKYGILFKGGVSIEALKNVKAVVMDKTGTLTKGEFAVQRVFPVEGVSEQELLAICAAAEAISTHPIALSIVKAAQERGLQLQQPDSFKEIAGEGLVAQLGADEVLCGNIRLMEHYGIEFTDFCGLVYGSHVLVAKNGRYLGEVVVRDEVKADATSAIAKLKQWGIAPAMLTGDAAHEAEAVGKIIGVDEVHADLLPQDKLAELQKLRVSYGPVMFVGDGINDTPVLAGADVGAAMGSGADAAIEAADVVFMNSEAQAIPRAIRLAQLTTSIAWQNVVFALGVKIAIMLAGLFGYASMWAAVFADTGVTAICIFNAIRILYKNLE